MPAKANDFEADCEGVVTIVHTECSMKAALCGVLILFFVAFALSTLSQTSTNGEKVWYWFADCHDGKMLGVQVLLDRKPIYRAEFRACQMDRNVTNSESKVFYFPGGHTFQREYHTKKTERIEGNIWQAGADPDGLLLGLSFMTKDRVLLNTIHIAKPDKIMETEIDSGVFVKTYPLSSGPNPDQPKNRKSGG